MEDLNSNTLSIRNYDFKNNSISEIKQNYSIDKRHKGEFAYHIVRNLLLNGLKLKEQKNITYEYNELKKGFGILLSRDKLKHENNFRKLYKLKKIRSTHFPEWTLEWVKTFVKDFQKSFTDYWKDAKTVYFMRHATTSFNDGSFLGQGRNPGIIGPNIKLLDCLEFEKKFIVVVVKDV